MPIFFRGKRWGSHRCMRNRRTFSRTTELNRVNFGKSASATLRIQESVSSESLAIDPLDYRSSLIAPFRDFPESGLLSTPISRYWKAEVDSSLCVVDLAFANQDPLIFHMKQGRGSFIGSSPLCHFPLQSTPTKIFCLPTHRQQTNLGTRSPPGQVLSP